MEQSKSVEILNAVSNVLNALDKTFIPDRSKKDEIVSRCSEIILKELKNIDV